MTQACQLKEIQARELKVSEQVDGPKVAPEHWKVPPQLNQSFG
jgi:hypothetical protein